MLKELSFSKRFIYPLLWVIGFKLIVGFCYDASSTLAPGTLKDILINIFGPLTFLSLWFFAFIGPPIAYFRGARFMERLIIAFANPLIWVFSVESQVACQFCLPELIYFFFLPWTFGIISITFIEFSLSEFICRYFHRKRNEERVILLHPAVLSFLAIGLTGTYLGLIKGQEWVYFIVNHYKTHFS